MNQCPFLSGDFRGPSWLSQRAVKKCSRMVLWLKKEWLFFGPQSKTIPQSFMIFLQTNNLEATKHWTNKTLQFRKLWHLQDSIILSIFLGLSTSDWQDLTIPPRPPAMSKYFKTSFPFGLVEVIKDQRLDFPSQKPTFPQKAASLLFSGNHPKI